MNAEQLRHLQRAPAAGDRETSNIPADIKIRWIGIIWAQHINLGEVANERTASNVVVVPDVGGNFVSSLLTSPGHVGEDSRVGANVNEHISISCLLCPWKDPPNIATSDKHHHAAH